MPLVPHRSVIARFALLFTAGALMVGCRSAFVQAVVRNQTDRPITLIEVDYPSASFGRELLLPHTEFQYRFKILGSGTAKVEWTDANRHEHSASGSPLHEGQQGTVEINLGESGAVWHADLH